MVSASADGSVIGFAESNASDGPFGLYKVSDGSLTRSSIGRDSRPHGDKLV